MGAYHSCATLTDGTVQTDVKCWGYNSVYGAVGDGTMTDRHSPVSVDVGGTVALLSCGTYHTCVTLTDDTLKCWGDNRWGQLGDGTSGGSDVDHSATRNTPTTISVGGPVAQLECGNLGTCVVLTVGTVKCWGKVSGAGFGDGTTNTYVTPTVIDLGGNVKTLKMNAWAGCAFFMDGALKCWGKNSYGSVGDGTTSQRLTPTTITVGGTIEQLQSGQFHFCVLLTGGTIKCWGHLVDGMTSITSTPTTMPI